MQTFNRRQKPEPPAHKCDQGFLVVLRSTKHQRFCQTVVGITGLCMCRQDFVNEVNEDLRQLQNSLSSGSHFAFFAHSLKPNWNCWKINAYFDPFMENIFSHIVCQHSQHACPLESNQQTHFDLQSQNKHTKTTTYMLYFCFIIAKNYV